MPGIFVFSLNCFISLSIYEALTLPPALPIKRAKHFSFFNSCNLAVFKYFFSQKTAGWMSGSMRCFLPLPYLMITWRLCRSISVVFSCMSSLILMAVAYDNSTIQRF